MADEQRALHAMRDGREVQMEGASLLRRPFPPESVVTSIRNDTSREELFGGMHARITTRWEASLTKGILVMVRLHRSVPSEDYESFVFQ